VLVKAYDEMGLADLRDDVRRTLEQEFPQFPPSSMRASHGGSSGNPNHVEQREIGLKIRDRNDLLARPAVIARSVSLSLIPGLSFLALSSGLYGTAPRFGICERLQVLSPGCRARHCVREFDDLAVLVRGMSATWTIFAGTWRGWC